MAPAENSGHEVSSGLRAQTRGNALVTDFVPSEIACFASSPGRMRRTEVWISREEIVDFFEYAASSATQLAQPRGHRKQTH